MRYQLALTGGDLEINGPADFIAINAATIDTAGRYSKLWAQVEVLHPLSDGSAVNFRLSGQMASRNLDSSEKFLLGGYNGVRAYPEGEAAGDEALLARLEWIRPLSFSAMSGKAALRAFVDGGTRLDRRRPARWRRRSRHHQSLLARRRGTGFQLEPVRTAFR